MGNNISTSIVNIMAEMITADNAEVGIYLQYGVKKAHALRMRSAVTQPANVVRTPLAACIADRPKDAVTGIEPINDPTNWHTPKATISWDASIVLPGAITNKMRKLNGKSSDRCSKLCITCTSETLFTAISSQSTSF